MGCAEDHSLLAPKPPHLARLPMKCIGTAVHPARFLGSDGPHRGPEIGLPQRGRGRVQLRFCCPLPLVERARGEEVQRHNTLRSLAAQDARAIGPPQGPRLVGKVGSLALIIHCPTPRNGRPAVGAATRCGEPVFNDVEAEAFDQERTAVGAIGVLELPSPPRHISGIDITQPGRLADPGRSQ